MLYEKHFNKLEPLRWRLTQDIDWHLIDALLLTDKQKQIIHQVCKTEIGSLFATEAFLRDFYDNIDFSCFVSVWYYEEMKHFLVLKRYLSCLGIEIGNSELQPLRMTIPESNQETILMIHFLSEHRLAAWYQSMSDWLEEPVGKTIFKCIADDEIRHGQAYFDFIQEDLRKHPNKIIKYLKAAQFMLSPKAPADMHAVTLTGTTDRLEDPDYILFIENDIVSDDKKNATAKRIYALLSILAQHPIKHYSSIAQYVKSLKHSELTSGPRAHQAL